jgi:hypothetical protein
MHHVHQPYMELAERRFKKKTLNCQVSIKCGIDTEFKVFKVYGDVIPD